MAGATALFLAGLGILAASPAGAVTVWSPSGACGTVQSTTVPAGVYTMAVNVAGGAGGKGAGQAGGTTSDGGKGGELLATLPVTPGQTISAVVGCAGANGDGGNSDVDTPTTAGWSRGGGTGQGSNTAFNPNGASGGGGGGSSAVCLGASCLAGSSTPLAVAGGGGGSGTSSCALTTGQAGGVAGSTPATTIGGGGSGPSGAQGGNGASSGSIDNGVQGGAGGSNAAGGAANGGSSPDGSGGLGVSVVGGGGGGGFVGGGAGANNSFGCAAGAGGGGGSSWVKSTAVDNPTYKVATTAKVIVTFAAPIAAAPGTPTVVGGNGQATVTWNKPSSSKPITGYTVTPYIGGVAQTPLAFDATLTKRDITGLANGTTYTFTVFASTEVGPSVPSAQSLPVTIGVPGAPSLASAAPLDGGAKVSWYSLAANGAPITTVNITPIVGGVPQTPLVLPYTGNSVTITGLANGSSYAFKVTATNSIGTGPSSSQTGTITIGVPGTPGTVTAVNGDASAKVSWHAPVANGGPITSYTITPYIGTVAQAPQAFASAAVTQTVTGLTNGSTYTFKVMATNAFGNSPLSPASAALKIGIPSAPTGVTVTSGDFSAKIGWSTFLPNGAPIDTVTITPYLSGVAQAAQVFTSAVSPATVTGIFNGETYTFKIVGHNVYGDGPAVTTAPIVLGLPSAAGSVVATTGNGQASLTWHAPTNPGPAIMFYRITPYIGTFPQTPIDTPTADLSYVVPGLSNGTAYTFKVAAVNPVGTGPQSPASAAITIGAPSAPSLASAVAQDGSAKVQWTALSDNGSPLTSITVTPYINGVAQAPQVLAPTATKSVVVTGLTNGTAYTFRVFATNANGNGGLSSLTGAVTIGAPVTMSAPTVAAGPGQVTVTWKVPASNNGSAVTGYVVTPYKAGVAQTPIVYASTALSQVVTGLTPGTAYTFRVAATNARGTGPISAASASVTPT